MNNSEVMEALRNMKGGQSALSRVVGGSSKMPKNIGKYTTGPQNDHYLAAGFLSGGMSVSEIKELTLNDLLQHGNEIKKQVSKQDITQLIKLGKKILPKTTKALKEVSNSLGGDTKKYYNMGKKYADSIMKKEGLSGGSKFWNDFKKGFNMVMRPAANISKVVAPIAAAAIGPEALLIPLAFEGMAQATGGKMNKPKTKRKQSEKQIRRNDMVRKLMRENGMTLPEASKYIKQNNLI